MKKIVKAFICLLILTLTYKANAQGDKNMGIGIRLGDPTGITFKKYMGNRALEISFGRTHTFYGRGWYNDKFNNWYNGWHKEKGYAIDDFQYLGYKASPPLGLQVHYILFQKDINALNGLQWYLGVGGQFRFQSYRYDFRYKLDGNPNWIYVDGERVTNIDLGVDGVIGLEYHIPNLPISVFGDMTLFMEVADNPFAFWLQGGLGGRFNF